MTTIQIDQTLHGYSRGHKELASSASLDARSRSAMLSFSDLLISPGADSMQSYLSAYPLKAAQRFIFARTWLAGEGLRPGSVWTHSLILDFPALTLIDDLSSLISLFRLPSDGDFSPYQYAINFNEERVPGDDLIGRGTWERAHLALRQLYGAKALQTAVLPSDGTLDEILAVALWRQMWPALRRNFAFLTGPAKRAPKFEAECSLHFQRGRFDDPGPATSEELNDGFGALARDLWKPGPTDLRAFIGRYAIEAERPRELVPALALLHDIDRREPLTVKLEKIRALKETADLPRLIRDTIVGGLMQAPREEELLALVEEYRNQPAPNNLGDAIAPLVKRGDVDQVRLLTSTQPSREGELGALIFDSVIKGAPLETLVDATERGIDRVTLLKARPELWTTARFWPKSDDARVALVRETGRTLTMADALDLFMADIGPGIANLAVRDTMATPQTVLNLLDRVVPQAAGAVAEKAISNPKWVEAFASHPELVTAAQLKLLCDACIRRGEKFLSPESWIALVMGQARQGDGQLDNSALTVGFAACLNVPAQRAMPVAKLTYDPLIRNVRAYRISREQERFLFACFPSAGYSTLRHLLAAGVVEKWHSNEINLQALSISSDVEALKDIVDLLVIRFGRSKFEAALSSKSIAPVTLAQVGKVYQPKSKKKKKASLWWWDW